MKKLYVVFIMLLINFMAYGANFSVAPTRFELRVDKVETNEVYITNNTNRPLRIETYIESDQDFGKDYNLNENIAIFPKVVVIKPAGKQIIRFRVKPTSNLKNGEYKSYIVFKEIPYEVKTSGEKKKDNDGASNVIIVTELGISVYGITGDEILKGRIENFKLTCKNNVLGISFDSISEGNTSIKYRYLIEDSRGKNLAEGRVGNSLRNGKTKIGVALTEINDFKGKNIKVKILDQKNNLLKEEQIKI